MKLSQLAAAALLTLGAGSANAYENLNKQWGLITADPDYTVNGIFNVPLNLSDVFEDYHFFSISLDSVGTGVLSNLISFNNNSSFKRVIAGMRADLYLDFGTLGDNDVSDQWLLELGTSSPGAVKNAYFIADTGPLDMSQSNGNYYIKISGYGAGTDGGTYSFQASAVPVPEAETWAMMAMGLGLVGLQLRRKAKKSEAAIAC